MFAPYETSQRVQSRLVKISYDWICLLESGLFDFVSSAEIALPQIKLHAGKARITTFYIQSVCSTCENVLYMYRIFSVAVSVAVHVAIEGFSDSFVSYETSQWVGPG